MNQIDQAIAAAEQLLDVLRKIKNTPPLPLTVSETKNEINKLTGWLRFIDKPEFPDYSGAFNEYARRYSQFQQEKYYDKEAKQPEQR